MDGRPASFIEKREKHQNKIFTHLIQYCTMQVSCLQIHLGNHSIIICESSTLKSIQEIAGDALWLILWLVCPATTSKGKPKLACKPNEQKASGGDEMMKMIG